MKETRFKNSEVGLIPKDWKVVRLGDVANIYRGGSPRPIEHYITILPTGINWIKIGDVAPKSKYIERTEEKIKSSGVSSSRKVYEGDLLLSNSMSFGRPYILKINGCIHDGWLVIQNYAATFYRDYLFYTLSSNEVLTQYGTMAAGSSVQNLNKEKVANVKMPLPPINEQKKIAEVLSDVDALIVELGNLIAKKHLIRKGVMQQLLTGSIHLKGFKETWRTLVLKQVTPNIVTGATPSTSNQRFWNGNIRWMNSGELNLKYVYEVEGRITQAGYKCCSTHLLPAYCVLIGLAGQGRTRGTAAINYVQLCTNQSIAAILPSDNMDAHFLFYLMDYKYDELRAISSGDGGRGGLTKKMLLDFKISIPSLNEQHAIAEILKNVDAEIVELKQKKAKYEKVRQGMMQQLLTGRIRLI